MAERNDSTQKIFLLLGLLSILSWQVYPHIKHYLEADVPQLLAIDTATGRVKWQSSFPDATDRFQTAPVALSPDRILVTQFARASAGASGGACEWVEFDRSSGRVVWRKRLQELGLDSCPAPYIPPVAQDGKLYTFWRKSINYGERSEQGILAMDFTTHRILWNMPIPQRWRDDSHEKALILADGKLIAGVSDSAQKAAGTDLTALNPQTGAVLWQAHHEGALSYHSSQGQLSNYDKSLIFLAKQEKSGDQWVSHSLETGRPIAIQSTSFKWIWKILPKGNQIYVLGEHDNRQNVRDFSITNFQIADGKFSWVNQPINVSPSNCSGLLDFDAVKRLFLVTCQGAVIALDDQTYQAKWQVQSDRYSVNMLVETAGDRLFIITHDRISAVASSDGRVLWRLPAFNISYSKIEGDILLVIARIPRKALWNINQLKPSKP
jgi:outer membrane protein assembly factor BamB